MSDQERLQQLAAMVQALLSDENNKIQTAYRLTLEAMLKEQ